MNPHRNLRNHHTLEPALKFPEPSGTNPKNHTGTHTRTNALEAETPERPHCNLPTTSSHPRTPGTWTLSSVGEKYQKLTSSSCSSAAQQESVRSSGWCPVALVVAVPPPPAVRRPAPRCAPPPQCQPRRRSPRWRHAPAQQLPSPVAQKEMGIVCKLLKF